uniref:Uncharacterized protein n=1 Tax=Anguilla anguilla TaxID=7936 RepID=A0A0E9RDE7_ANGAN
MRFPHRRSVLEQVTFRHVNQSTEVALRDGSHPEHWPSESSESVPP